MLNYNITATLRDIEPFVNQLTKSDAVLRLA